MEKMLPLGRMQKVKTAYCTVVLHVVGYENGHNIWAEKSRRDEDNHY